LLDLEPVESAYILLGGAALRLGAMVREYVFSRQKLRRSTRVNGVSEIEA
jgi:hypothetical protein